MDEGLGEAEPLPHAARQRLDLGIAANVQANEFEHFIDEPVAARPWDAVAAREVVEVFPDQHILVEAEEVRHIADQRMHAQPARRVLVDKRLPYFLPVGLTVALRAAHRRPELFHASSIVPVS